MVTLEQEHVGSTDSIVKVSQTALFLRSYFNLLVCLTIKINSPCLNIFFLWSKEFLSMNFAIILILKNCQSVTPTLSSFFLPQRHATWLHGIGFSFNMAAKKCLNSEVSKIFLWFGLNAQFVTRWMQQMDQSYSFLLRWYQKRNVKSL